MKEEVVAFLKKAQESIKGAAGVLIERAKEFLADAAEYLKKN